MANQTLPAVDGLRRPFAGKRRIALYFPRSIGIPPAFSIPREEGMKPALLVIDVQKMFFGDNPARDAELKDASRYINAAIGLFRKKNLPVICIQHTNPEDQLVPGQPGFDVPDILNILPGDTHIHKTYGNSFTKTPLADTLRRMEVDTVVATGFAAEGCVLATVRGAQDYDFTSMILRGAIIGGRPGVGPLVESINDIISYNALEKALE
jgi:nicotinamidase-related amidase